MSNLIAIVGRPNVGKSALFNRIVGRRIAIVHDQPGVTRDRISAEAEWHGRPFTLVDTGGIGLLRREKAGDVIVKAAMEQVDLAIEAANVIILVVNVQEGIVPLDREVTEKLRRSGKPVLVAVNKVDTSRAEKGLDEFSQLGFEKMFPVSAIHGEGIQDLMDTAVALLPVHCPESTVQSPLSIEHDRADEMTVDRGLGTRDPGLKLAIVGRPNVGKSSIINALTQSARVIVSPVPGTTRDSVDVPFEVETDGVRQKYVLIDTAGMRKARRVDDSVEFFSVQRAVDSIARSDITVLVLDAEMGITEQDKKIADKIVEARKACIVVVNKWDLVAESVRQVREEVIEKRNKKIRSEGQAKIISTLGEFGDVGAGEIVFPGLRAGHFHVGQVGLQPRPAARGGALRGRAVAAENSHGDSEPHVARRRGPPPAGQRGGAPAQIFLRDAGAAGAADVSAVRQPRRVVFRPVQEISGRPDAPGIWLRRLSAGAGAQTAPENRGADTKVQSSTSKTIGEISAVAQKIFALNFIFTAANKLPDVQ